MPDYGAASPLMQYIANLQQKGHDLMSGDFRHLLGFAPEQQQPDPAQPMNWTPQANAEQQQQIQSLPQMKKPLPKGK
jgi:hypothetical protein